MNKPRTAEEARDWLSFQGITIAQWARERSFSDSLVREVLAGRKKCLRGQSHNIAVALGMKRGVPTTRPARVAPAAQRANHAGAAA
jgi:gp16 family phage-associated protein